MPLVFIRSRMRYCAKSSARVDVGSRRTLSASRIAVPNGVSGLLLPSVSIRSVSADSAVGEVEPRRQQLDVEDVGRFELSALFRTAIASCRRGRIAFFVEHAAHEAGDVEQALRC